MFSEPPVTSSPLYSAPMITPLSVGPLGGHCLSRANKNSHFLPLDKARQQQRVFNTVVPRSGESESGYPTQVCRLFKELIHCLMLRRSNIILTISLPTITLPLTATNVVGTITPSHRDSRCRDNHPVPPRLTKCARKETPTFLAVEVVISTKVQIVAVSTFDTNIVQSEK
uniref:Uncharacterized protein n=1 Tax=Timema tahoe TaxID=61484 RepID=A0A7R9IEY7_9NEOP|nr:unnamed protein product [Timema tahoe]